MTGARIFRDTSTQEKLKMGLHFSIQMYLHEKEMIPL